MVKSIHSNSFPQPTQAGSIETKSISFKDAQKMFAPKPQETHAIKKLIPPAKKLEIPAVMTAAPVVKESNTVKAAELAPRSYGDLPPPPDLSTLPNYPIPTETAEPLLPPPPVFDETQHKEVKISEVKLQTPEERAKTATASQMAQIPATVQQWFTKAVNGVTSAVGLLHRGPSVETAETTTKEQQWKEKAIKSLDDWKPKGNAEEAKKRIIQAIEKEMSYRSSWLNLINTNDLDLSNLDLDTLPSVIWELSSLTRLNLANNSLTILPPTIGNLKSLKSAELDNNKLKSIPQELGNIKGLEGVNIAYNPLESRPPKLGQLKYFYFGSTEVYTTEKAIYMTFFVMGLSSEEAQRMAQQDYKYVDEFAESSEPEDQYKQWADKAIKSLDDWKSEGDIDKAKEIIIRGIRRESSCRRDNQSSGCTFIDLTNCGLNNLPPVLWELTRLEDLNLSGNKLTSLSPQIGQLTKLTSLNLSSNQLKEILPVINNMKSLTHIDLSKNPILSYPNQIGELLYYSDDNQEVKYLKKSFVELLNSSLSHQIKEGKINKEQFEEDRLKDLAQDFRRG